MISGLEYEAGAGQAGFGFLEFGNVDWGYLESGGFDFGAGLWEGRGEDYGVAEG